jgi:SAM-dependent methyltransferase
MSTDTTADPGIDLEAEVGAYAERLFGVGLAAFEAASIALGRRLGLYRALEDGGPSTATELGAAAGIHPRYAREWLEQQAVAGYLAVDDVDAAAEERRYTLPIAAAVCLNDPESLASVGPLFDFYTSLGPVFPALQRAFREGGGVPYADYGIHDVQGDFNRPAFLNLLTTQWLPAVPGVVDRLASGTARVAEIGSGEGWAAIAIARAWPGVRVDGFDLDDASVAAARRHAAEAGVADRVTFEVADVAETSRFADGGYDLVLAFEMVHDLARPVDALATMRRLGRPDAAFVVMDERVAERFEAPTENPVERLFYVASVLHCLPAGMAEQPSAATGTVMRPDTLRGYATAAGFADAEVLPIEHDLFRFYRLVNR